MKFSFFKHIALLILGIGLCCPACDVDDLDQLTDGVVIDVSTDIVRLPLVVSFTPPDADSADPLPAISVSVSGADADQIFSPLGERQLSVIDGSVVLATKKTLDVSPASPLRFDLVVEAPGFRTQTIPLEITDIETTQNAVIPLTPEGGSFEDLPSDSKVAVAVAGVGTATATNLAVDAENDLDLNLPPGTQLFAADGTELDGDVTFEVRFSDANSREDLANFPTSIINATWRGADGNEFDHQLATVFGYYEITGTAAGQEVAILGQPLSVSMEITRQFRNPLSSIELTENNVLPVFSLDEAAGVWVFETFAELEDDNGTLTANFEQNHFSKWAVMDFIDRPTSPTPFTIFSPLKDDEATTLRSFSLAYLDGTEIFSPLTLLSTYEFHQGQSIRLNSSFLFPKLDQPVVLTVHEGGLLCPDSEVIGTSVPFNPFGNAGVIEIPDLSESPLTITISATGICPAVNSADARIFPSGIVYYRPTGCPFYEVMGEVRNGKLVTRALRPDAVYDFLAYYGDATFETQQVPVATGEYAFGTETIRIAIDGNDVLLEYLDVTIPDAYCELFN